MKTKTNPSILIVRCAAFNKAGKGDGRNTFAARLVAVFFLTALLFFGAGCTTMSVTPLTTCDAAAYAQHDQKGGLVIGIQPITNKGEVKDMFKVNLLDKGLLPILVVAENQSVSDSFIIAKEKITVLTDASGASSSSQRKQVTSGATGTALGITGAALAGVGSLAAVPLVITGMKLASNATVIQHGLADKEFYSRTLGPGEKAQGFVYFQFPKESPPTGGHHVVAEIKNSATGETAIFDFSVNLTLHQ